MRTYAEPRSWFRWARGIAELTVDDALGASLAPVALGGSIGTPEEGLRAEVVQVRDLEELASIDPRRIAGRIVYLAHCTQRTRDASGYVFAVRGRAAGPSAAAAKGAVAFVIRSVGTSDNRLAHTGTTVYNIGSPRIPAVAISNPDA
ncbi:MAG: peptidase M28 family protein, partial [Steroidobacteraceae bacterium]